MPPAKSKSGNARALAVRVGHVGELGWELYIPQDYAAHVYETLREAGEPFDIADAGYRAIESCRLEKGYLYWSADITPDTNPYEAGLGFAVALKKGDFIGRAALAKVKASGVARKLVALSVDGFAPFLGGETVIVDSQTGRATGQCGSTTASSTGRSVLLTFRLISPDWTLPDQAFGTAYDAVRGPRCHYDAKQERLKA
ncbi:MAG: hypothetical protein R3D43_07150 [Tepidamorphaceae bacterium]